jgi:predicted TIM-barrel fold metal-dependent hydrolase
MTFSSPGAMMWLPLLLLSSPAFLQSQDYTKILLNEFNPKSIYKIPVSRVEKARYPAIDFHSHDYPKSDQEVEAWVRTMDACNISKSIILSYTTGPAFDAVIKKYSRHPDRFEVWCGFDYTGMNEPGWAERAIKELERCHALGARGVGELGDKGLGEYYSKPTPGIGMHVDDPRLKPLLKRCGELGMPVSIHVAEDAWMYEAPDASNDGLMNSAKWHVDMNVPGKLGHDALIQTLENAVRDHPGTLFIACHLANSCADLGRIAGMLDRYPNLYTEMAARFGEIAPIPRQTKAFMEKYSRRILYGTDMGTSENMYRTTFRILETADEHFYEKDRFNYHWPLHGLDLSDKTLKKIYNLNGEKILKRR